MNRMLTKQFPSTTRLLSIFEPILFIIYLILAIIGGIIFYPWMLYVSWFAPDTNVAKNLRR